MEREENKLKGRKESGNYLIRLSVHLEAGRPVSPFRQFVAREATSRSAAPRCVRVTQALLGDGGGGLGQKLTF